MKVADLTVEELKTIIRDTVDEALMGYDPDYGLKLRPEFVAEMLAQADSCEPTIPADEVWRKLGLE